jgi:endonuclease YncB( thermonuclease family)
MSRPTRRPAPLAGLVALSLLALLPAGTGLALPRQEGALAAPAATRPATLHEVVKVVDGDTLHVLRGEKVEKLRLLSVDTEEKFMPGMQSSASKPQTVYGEETMLWAIDFFEQFRGEDGKIRVGLRFPGGREEYDVYGRLLCHVLLEDGTDFNLLLVELGKSPYFNKYGNSRICHEDFVAAQRRARRNLLGIWDPRTNLPESEDVPDARRPYGRLLPWWSARAEAIDDFRRRSGAAPGRVLSAEDGDALEAALASEAEVEVFGTPDRFFDEDDGSLTVLMRTSDRQRALRVSIPAASRGAFEAFDLEGLASEYRQNYAYVRGRVTRGPRGFRITTPDPAAWRRAGREP